MKNYINKTLVMVAMLVALVFVPVMNAGILKLYQTVNNGDGGGIFKLTITEPIGELTTFCLEKTEYVTPGVPYSYILNNKAVSGGPNDDGGAIGYDVISIGTASLYNRYIHKTLFGNFDVNIQGDGGILQRAIWALEDEISYSDAGGASNPYLNDVTTLFGSFASAKLDYTGEYVKVLNIFDQSGRKQDMLFVSHVPEVSSTMFAALGLCGFVVWKRKH